MISKIYFNSIKVRLKLNSLHYDSEAKRNFNSIKVRLKLTIVVLPEPSIEISIP